MTIKEWWNTERIHRAEKDTSQDFAPTNGEAVVFMCLMSFAPVMFFLVFIVSEGL